jgi:sporulation protein YlmC with PRC-barrel domain
MSDGADDPVSWFLIEPGWEVVDSGGEKVGTVAEVEGDEENDIFSGLEVSTGLIGKPHYVPSESVGTIVQGRVALTIPKSAVG